MLEFLNELLEKWHSVELKDKKSKIQKISQYDEELFKLLNIEESYWKSVDEDTLKDYKNNYLSKFDSTVDQTGGKSNKNDVCIPVPKENAIHNRYWHVWG